MIERKKVTLRDIAERTGYSVNTVSRALKNPEIVAAPARREIQTAARELGYVPNRAARMLRSGHTRTLALIVGYMLNPFFGMIFEYVRQEAADRGYNIMLLSANEDDVREQASIRAALEYGVEGVLLVPCQQTDGCIPLLERSGVPFVLLCREFPGRRVNYVGCDKVQAGRLAALHLMDANHERLIYLCDDGRVTGIAQRREGFLVQAEGRAVVRVLPAANAGGRPEGRMGVAREILRLNREEGYTAMAAFCDMVARDALFALRTLDAGAAERMGVVGFDDIDGIAPSPLPLCSVSSDYRGICARAIGLLLGEIEGGTRPPERIVFPVEVHCRGSCRRTSG